MVPGAVAPSPDSEFGGGPNLDIQPNHPYPCGDLFLPGMGGFRLKDPNAYIMGYGARLPLGSMKRGAHAWDQWSTGYAGFPRHEPALSIISFSKIAKR